MKVRFDFTGGRHVVTGATSGLGRRIALDLAEAGSTVLALGRRRERLAELAASHPGRIVTDEVDVCDPVALGEACARFAAGGPIDGSVHAAGVNHFQPLKDLDWAEVDRSLHTGLHAGLELVRLLTRRAVGRANSSHVQIASVMALVGQVGFTPYCAAKGAMLAAVRCMALELASRGARVNLVSPGWIPTEMTDKLPLDVEAVRALHPLGLGEPADVSHAALFLLSDASKWITGSNLVVDGGYTVR